MGFWESRVFAISDGGQPDQSSPAQSSPRIQFEERAFDFGIIGQGKTVTHVYRFRNTGGKPLVIEKVRNSCGCTASVVKETEISPGGDGEIKVTFQSGKYLGRQEKSIHVHSNDPNEPIVKLLISGEVKTDVGLQPEYLHFGDVSIKKGGAQKVRLYQLSDQDLKVEGVQINQNLFLTRIARFEQEEVKGWEIEVVLKPGVSPGLVSEVLSIQTNIPTKRHIDVPIMANVIGDIMVSPSMVSFGTIKKGEPVSQKILVRRPNDQGFQVIKVQSRPLFVHQALSFLGKEEGYEIQLTIPKDVPVGMIQGSIDISTNSVEQPLIQIPVYGRVEKVNR